MPRKLAPRLDTPALRSRLKLKSLQSEMLLRAHHSQAVAQLEGAGIKPGDIRRHAARLLTSGAVAASLLFSPLQNSSLAALPKSANVSPISPSDLRSSLQKRLLSFLPQTSSELSGSQEKQIETAIHEIYGIHAQAEIEGNRLNSLYGVMGAEQHLTRFPGDSVPNMAPGRGAWGYFANSQSKLTSEAAQQEKYYVAVQTLYLPDWSARLSNLRDWYKYRKVAVVNPRNGKLIVAVIADSGPASWTGKQFGGSPEVYDFLGLRDRHQAGPVILLLVDDPDNHVPLGPLEYNLEQSPLLLTSGPNSHV
jgi:hypothetical protein